MRWSIRYQLLVPLLTLFLGVVGMAVWTALASAQRARHQIEIQMHDIATTINTVTFPRNLQTLKLMKGLSGADFLLLDSHGPAGPEEPGRPLMTLSALPDSLPEPTNEVQDLHLGPRVKVGKETFFCQGIRLGQEGTRILYVFYPESLWREALWGAIWPALVFGTVGGLASLILTVLVAQRLGRRIQEMERRTSLIAAGDFSPMPLPRRNDELRDLGRSVNEMAQRLAQFQETVKKSERLRLLGQVSGGLAHQLRNGVTGARLAVQLHVKEQNGEATDESLDVALRQLALVEMHLKRFLDLGKAAELRREPCHLTTLIAETVTLLKPRCTHAGIDLRWQAPSADEEDRVVLGDRDQLRHLLLNIMTNAIEAAGPGGWVEVRSQMADGRWQIDTMDSGPGPTPEVAERLFEPFVTGKPEGVGLGLAVAKQVAEAHGGSLSWRRDQGKTCFRLELPILKPRMVH
ncbi:MAG TPA: HAMP domain-containing sensor histidine kinase [Gemmataceae bacterium]|nr:HAMP domain-containing sensor histidine kinase [Gemmataceae bacterium]